MERNHALVIQAAQMCANTWGTRLLCNEKCFASMATVELPEIGLTATPDVAYKLKQFLYNNYKIIVSHSPLITTLSFFLHLCCEICE
jgi:hypothetical protein